MELAQTSNAHKQLGDEVEQLKQDKKRLQMQLTSTLQNRSHVGHTTSMSAATPISKGPGAAAVAAANEAAAAAAAESAALKAELASLHASLAAARMEAEKRLSDARKAWEAGALLRAQSAGMRECVLPY